MAMKPQVKKPYKLRATPMTEKPKKWIKSAIKHPGALHKELGVPSGKKIPAKKLAAATKSSNPLEHKRANLAKTLSKMKK